MDGTYFPSDLRTKRLQEKMREALEQKKDSLDAKMWGYTSFDSAAPYDLFDFRVSRHRDGPDEFLSGYAGHVMADCYSGNMSVILAPGSKMTRMACVNEQRKLTHWRAFEIDPGVLHCEWQGAGDAAFCSTARCDLC